MSAHERDFQFEQWSREGALAMETIDRRGEARYPTEGPAAVVTLQASGIEVSRGRIVDVSKSGLRVCTDKALRVGVKVRVEFGDTVAFGEIRWCKTLAADCHDAGVLVSHVVNRTLVNNVKKAANGSDA